MKIKHRIEYSALLKGQYMSNFDWPCCVTQPLMNSIFPVCQGTTEFPGWATGNPVGDPFTLWIEGPPNTKSEIGGKKHKVINSIYIEGTANWAVWQLWWSMAGLRDQGNANGWNVDMKSYMARNTMLHGLKCKQNVGQMWSEVGLMTSLKTCIGCQKIIINIFWNKKTSYIVFLLCG